MSGSRPFVEGTRIQAERLASAALGYIGAQFAAGLSGLIAGVFAFLTAPFIALRNGAAALATGLTRAPTDAVRDSYGALEATVADLGLLGFVAAIGAVLMLGYIAVQGRDLLG
ncbi:hypothetical protein [Haloplanus natans]|uniref:hypothetical protein n=1 Tax=Haloplanus natans TaxID=376171 RepID=UPI00067783E5|nr:hypothetical protein [Haloplanus natans]